MSRLAYVNGRFLRQGEAGVSIEDRGYQLGDGIYEVWAVMDGRRTRRGISRGWSAASANFRSPCR
jgi:branched-subunit amino acid aminotransferase/4-amino-4-deoxychorismate lyase